MTKTLVVPLAARNATGREGPAGGAARAGTMGERQSLGVPNYQRVRDAIRDDIARGNLAPDGRLKIGDLTIRYGLSPAPIREALNQLAAEGWVVIHPNRGAWVRNINEALFRELNEIRVALESYNVALCAAVATPAEVDRLEQIEEEYERCLARSDAGPMKRKDVATLVRINASLHDAIHAIRPNHEARMLMERYGKFFNAMRMVWGYGDYRPRQIAAEHRALIAAFRANNGAEAERICRHHIGNAMEDLLARWHGEFREPQAGAKRGAPISVKGSHPA
jgi:DNA-binding GntR family transcriptional regulator